MIYKLKLILIKIFWLSSSFKDEHTFKLDRYIQRHRKIGFWDYYSPRTQPRIKSAPEEYLICIILEFQ